MLQTTKVLRLIKFDDISRPGGEPSSSEAPGLGHASHKNGLDVDIRYRYNTDAEGQETGINFELSNDLIARFAADSDCDVIYIGTHLDLSEPEKVERLQTKHQTHFHVSYEDPD